MVCVIQYRKLAFHPHLWRLSHAVGKGMLSAAGMLMHHLPTPAVVFFVCVCITFYIIEIFKHCSIAFCVKIHIEWYIIWLYYLKIIRFLKLCSAVPMNVTWCGPHSLVMSHGCQWVVQFMVQLVWFILNKIPPIFYFLVEALSLQQLCADWNSASTFPLFFSEIKKTFSVENFAH